MESSDHYKNGALPKSHMNRTFCKKPNTMKKFFLTVLTTIFTLTVCFSQDLITKKSGEDIQAKVLEVTTSEIKYKKSDNLNGPIFSILKSEVLLVRYENGTKDMFVEENWEETISPVSLSIEDSYNQGRLDASKYYDGYKGAGTGTLVVSLISPLVGMVPAIACSSTQPKDINLNYPNSEMMKNFDYYNGYTQKSRKIKQGKVWKNWGIAFGVNLVAVIFLTSQRQAN